MTKQKQKLKRLVLASAIAAALLLVLVLLRLSSAATSFLHVYLSRSIVTSAGKISSLVPFSLYEVFLYIVGIFLIASLILIIANLVRRKFARAAIRLMAVVIAALTVANIYFISAGFAYKRHNEDLEFGGFYATYAELSAVCDFVLNDFNTLSQKFSRNKSGLSVSPYTDKQLAELMVKEYQRINDDTLNPYTPICKTIASSRLMSQMHITGVFFAPFGEPNINKNMPDFEKPFTMAHELAHAKGLMREDEANMMASLITLTSTNDYIRYSGYMSRAFYLFDAFYLYNDPFAAAHYLDLLHPVIWAEYQASFDYWDSHSLLSSIMSAINNFYLNLMGQSEGTDAYTPETGTPVDPNAPVNPDIPSPANPDPNAPNPPDPNPPDPNPPDPNPTNPDAPDNPANPSNPSPSYIYPEFSGIHRLFFSIYESAAANEPDTITKISSKNT